MRRNWWPRRPRGFHRFEPIPVAFVDGDHFARVARDAAVREEVRRVGEDQVNGGFRDGGENFQAVALVDLDVMLAILKRG